jgi:hypothetical protein
LTIYINSYADKRYLLSCGICSGYGLAAAAEQESVRKSTKQAGVWSPRGTRFATTMDVYARVGQADRTAAVDEVFG